MDLFTPDDGHYEYSAVATNLPLGPAALWAFACGRGAQEKTIAELKGEYALDVVTPSPDAAAAVVLLHTPVLGVAGDGYRGDLREIARAEGATLVEDFLVGVVPARTYDGLHPDEQGQGLLADRLLPVLRDALGRP